MIELLALIVLGMLGFAVLRGVVAGLFLLLRALLRLGWAALLGAVIWAVVQMIV